jgi:hypothetical protein
MLAGSAEAGGHQQRAELVAVQGDGMRLVVRPRPPDVSGWGVLEEFLFDGVLVEPGDGAQPPGHGGPGPAPGFQVAGEAFDVGAADREQRQGTGAALGGELTQIQCVSLSCQAAVPGQEPGEREPFGITECWLDGDEAVVVAVIGYLPVRAETDEAGPAAASATIRSPPSSRRVRHLLSRSASAEPRAAPGNAP